MTNSWLFILCCLTGGAGWIATPIQIHYVSPEACVAYRFIAAGLLTLLYAAIKKKGHNLNQAKDYALCAAQGGLLFGFNYILVYLSAYYIVSGLIAVTVSLLIIPAMGWRWLLFKNPPAKKDVVGAFIGIGGVYLLFAHDIRFSTEVTLLGFGLAFASTFLSSLGMNISEKLKNRQVNIIWATGYAMTFGGFLMLAFSIVRTGTLDFSFTFNYLWSLGYLIILTALMFPMYLVLSSRIGAGKASYVWIVTPLVSLTFSNIFESYTFTWERLIGAILIVAGGFYMKKAIIKPKLR